MILKKGMALMITSPLKWVGGKQKILKDILPHIGSCDKFVDVFAGSMTVSLNVDSQTYIINDINPDLIWFYKHVSNNYDNIVKESNSLFHDVDEKKYYSVRDKFNSLEHGNLERSILFLFLNKFGFNGICRYNSKGKFNVPYGKRTSHIVPEKNLECLSTFLTKNRVTLLNKNFIDNIIYETLDKNSVVYFDPPYLPSDEFKTGFTQYTKESFSYEDHVKIKNISLSLIDKGVRCVISNNDTEASRKLYADASEKIQITKQRMLAGDPKKRIPVQEILVVYK